MLIVHFDYILIFQKFLTDVEIMNQDDAATYYTYRSMSSLYLSSLNLCLRTFAILAFAYVQYITLQLKLDKNSFR